MSAIVTAYTLPRSGVRPRFGGKELLAPAFVTTLGGLLLLRPALDPDLGWHLRAGQEVLAGGGPLTHDSFSFSLAGASWADFEWLWEAGLAALHRSGGMGMVIAAQAALLAAATLLVYGCLRQRQCGALTASLATLLMLGNLLAYANVRPGLSGAFFCALYLWLIERARRSGSWLPLAVLLPVQVLWANVHGSYIQGPLLCATFGIGLLLERREWRPATVYLGLAGSLVAASFANPLGAGLLRFTLGASNLGFNRDHNGEWLAPNFHSAAHFPLLLSLLLAMVLPLLNRGWKLGGPEVLLLAGSTLAVLSSNQFIPFYAVAGAPIIAQLLPRLSERLESRLALPALAAAVGLLTMLAGSAFINLRPEAYQKSMRAQFPVDAVGFIEQRQLQGPMFNEFDWGSYLISALPRLPVFVDGRTEMYGDEFLRRYLAVETGEEPAGTLFGEYHIRLALLKPHSPLANELRLIDGWQQLYEDDVAAVFSRGAEAA